MYNEQAYLGLANCKAIGHRKDQVDASSCHRGRSGRRYPNCALSVPRHGPAPERQLWRLCQRQSRSPQSARRRRAQGRSGWSSSTAIARMGRPSHREPLQALSTVRGDMCKFALVHVVQKIYHISYYGIWATGGRRFDPITRGGGLMQRKC